MLFSKTKIYRERETEKEEEKKLNLFQLHLTCCSVYIEDSERLTRTFPSNGHNTQKKKPVDSLKVIGYMWEVTLLKRLSRTWRKYNF